MFPSRYFTNKYFGGRYWAKGLVVNVAYQNQGDIVTKLIAEYHSSGDIQTIIGHEYNKPGDVYTILLKRYPQVHVSFNYDVQTQLQ